MHLQSASRIAAFLCVYFLALLVEALLERELRRTMKTSGVVQGLSIRPYFRRREGFLLAQLNIILAAFMT